MCGNVTLLGRLPEGDRGAVPDAARVLLERMLRISQMRGAQAGGGAVQVGAGAAPRQVIEKCVNSKRGDLASRMTRALGRAARGHSGHESTFLVQTHVRYATASVSTRHEAHPFQFVSSRDRGPRRVARVADGGVVTSVRPVETALTHNGDMDAMRWRGKVFGFSDLGCLLERILGVTNTWNGDSPVLAAAVEVYLTKGMWLESLRLAYHLAAAPMPPDPSRIASGLSGVDRRRAVRELMREYPAPSSAELSKWAAVAEQALDETLRSETMPAASDTVASYAFRERLAGALELRVATGFDARIPDGRRAAFARAAVHAFFDNDLYVAIRKLEPALHGTFGCVVTSTLEPGSLVAMCRGQPLSLGFDRTKVRVGVVSERAALKVHDESGGPAFEERLDLDLCRGEIARVAISDRDAIRLTLYGISDGRESDAEELVAMGRLVTIVDNPYVLPLPPEAKDRVAADFDALVPLLGQIQSDWSDAQSKNRRTARAFADKLFRSQRARVIVIGITNDLWLSQQFARNLSVLFAGVEARAVSSNEVLANPASVHLDEDTLVLAVSQSGQDFPTLGALVLLFERAPTRAKDAFFVLTGEVDSLLGQAVGQSYARAAPFSERIFTNRTGFRPSEAAIATVNATHLTLTELLLSLASAGLDTSRYLRPPLGLALDQRELQVLEARRDASVKAQVSDIVGVAKAGAGVRGELGHQAKRWSLHIGEGIVAFGLAVLVLELNLQLGLGLLPSTLLSLASGASDALPAWAASWVSVIGTQTNVLFYAFLGPLMIWGLRTLQRRPRIHRQGTRELLIGDTRYVHQIGWFLARKLFSLSYGFASIKPYSADCQDELVMTHEPLRGTLVLLGIPDGRRAHLRTSASAALMAAKQFNNSRGLGGGGPEIVTISHSPLGAAGGVGTHVCLPTVDVPELGVAGDTLLEGLFDSWERLVALQVFLDHLARSVSRLGPFRYDRSRTKDQVFAPTTAAPVSAADVYQLLSRTSERYESTVDVSLPFEVSRSEWRRSAPPQRTTAWRPEAVQRELERLEVVSQGDSGKVLGPTDRARQ